MALDTLTLKTSLKALFLANIPTPTTDQTDAIDTLCDGIATAMSAFVSSGTITYTSGLVAPPTGGPVTAPLGVLAATIS